MKKHAGQQIPYLESGASEPSGGLLDAVMLHIEGIENHRFHRRVIIFAALTGLAALSFIPAWGELHRELTSSGFSSFASLLSSDTATLASYWKEFSFSLLESLPVFGLVAVLGALFTLLTSLRLLILNISGGAHYARSAKHHG
jgi:hypothetical protein